MAYLMLLVSWGRQGRSASARALPCSVRAGVVFRDVAVLDMGVLLSLVESAWLVLCCLRSRMLAFVLYVKVYASVFPYRVW